MEDSENPIIRLTFIFSLEIIKYSEQLESKHKYIISRQLLSSGNFNRSKCYGRPKSTKQKRL